MASGSSRPIHPGSKPFAIPSDDVLHSYEDYGNPDGNNGYLPDHSIGANSTEEFHKSRMARSNVFPAVSFGPPEDSSFNQDLISTVDNTVKKYTDHLMRFLEGISSRLSQLELYCYNLDKSIGEMHSELARDHRESELKLKYLEKHVEEVHRSMQILRDKQELAETQKELAKLQLVQKESSFATNSQQNEEGVSLPAPDAKKSDNSSHNQGQPLAVSLPCQVASQPSVPTQPVEHQQTIVAPPLSMPSQSMPQEQAYYLPPMTSSQLSQGQYLPTQSQIQDHSRVAAQSTQPQLNQPQQIQSLPLYQQQWPPQHGQPPPPQLPPVPPQIRSSSPAVRPSYLSSPSEMTAPNSIPMQVPFSGPSQPGSPGSDGITPYGHGGAGRQIQPQPPTQHVKTAYSAQSGDVYVPSATRPTLNMGNAYTMFDSEGRRTHHPPPQPHFQQNAYPLSSIPLQNPQHTANLMVRPPQFMRNLSYTELIEKLVGMGYRGDLVVGVIRLLEESGQPIDFNAVLDRLNGHSSGGSQRGWSG
ncbi:Hypothetical predicted protein [Olea europaea subsp. europaea]|uniref:DUF1421 domain-containing protein n=1 Tax=Olea europaea subsp. europaea TaxID=158383 RepID=A0A8S0U6Z1_OLEEU|nr:Hypothetical predicted protein [Olea europaea subsp. europaea]